MSARCPKCGEAIAQVIKPAKEGGEEETVATATLACVGVTSCGWSLGFWFEPAFIDEMAGRLKARAA
jgi:uncharacterized protein with PIN domain